MDYYQTLIESKLDPVSESGDNIIYRCPVCEGNRGSGHLYINYKKGVYNCFRCSLGGRSIPTLLITLGYSLSTLKDYPLHILKKKSDLLQEVSKELSSKPKQIIDYSRDINIITEYFNKHTATLSDAAIMYLYKRGIGRDEIIHYDIREGIDSRQYTISGIRGSDYSGRILVPSRFYDGRVSFYVARDYLGRNNIPKYLNPPQTLAYSSEDVWNINNINSNSVIICEGVFTAIAAGGNKYNAVATYGKSISAKSNSDRSDVIIRSQGSKLLSKKFNTYIVAYDADARSETYKTCKYLYDRGANVFYVDVPPKYGEHTDLSDFSVSERCELLRESKKYSPSITDNLMI